MTTTSEQLYSTIELQLEQDGLRPTTFEYVIKFINMAIVLIESSGMPGSTKKDMVLDALNMILVEFDVPSSIRKFIELTAPVLIDTLVAAYNSNLFLKTTQRVQKKCCSLL